MEKSVGEGVSEGARMASGNTPGGSDGTPKRFSANGKGEFEVNIRHRTGLSTVWRYKSKKY